MIYNFRNKWYKLWSLLMQRDGCHQNCRLLANWNLFSQPAGSGNRHGSLQNAEKWPICLHWDLRSHSAIYAALDAWRCTSIKTSFFFSSSRAPTTAEGLCISRIASTTTLIFLYETRVISHIFQHNYSSDLSFYSLQFRGRSNGTQCTTASSSCDLWMPAG